MSSNTPPTLSKKKTIRRTIKRLHHRVEKISQSHYAAVITFTSGKYEVAGSPILCEILSKPEIRDSIQASINTEIARTYLKFPGRIEESKTENKNERSSTSEGDQAAENVETLMQDVQSK
ncbi:uncharacterized protein [Antedon mediterranea]|uniref:uncharacterized protein n=1 Tax=Antedon mediterranea TaxID=105859 RepID=UPI003AF5CD51